MTISQIAATIKRSITYTWRLVHLFGLQPISKIGKAGVYDYEEFRKHYVAGAYFV